MKTLITITLTILMITNSSLLAKKAIDLIENLTVHKNKLSVTINKNFKKRYLKSDFFVEYDEDINLEQFDYSIQSLPFIMNVISLIWISGEDYQVAEMDVEVYHSLERIKKVFEIMYPKTPWKGRLIAKKLVAHQPQTKTSKRSALLFSGGLDSTVSSFYHRDTPQLLITAWGQSGLPLEEQRLWEKVQKRMIDFAQLYGHENAFLKSNYYYFLDFTKLKHLSSEIVTWRTDTIEDIGWAGLIAPILLSKGMTTLRIAASEDWNITFGTASNPYIDSNIRFAGLRIEHDLFSMTRFDKIKYLVDLCNRGIVKKPQLIICQKPGDIITCNSCEKCCLTVALLLGAQADPQEYGFPLGPEEAAIEVKKHLTKKDSFMATTLWQYKALQKIVLKRPITHLTWLKDIDFSKKIPYNLKPGSHSFDWADLDSLFPSIRAEASYSP